MPITKSSEQASRGLTAPYKAPRDQVSVEVRRATRTWWATCRIHACRCESHDNQHCCRMNGRPERASEQVMPQKCLTDGQDAVIKLRPSIAEILASMDAQSVSPVLTKAV